MAAITRRKYIEMVRRLIYGGQPSDDSQITINLVNEWLNFGIAAAAQKNYTDNAKIEGIASVNNSFYTTFSSLSIATGGEFGLWKVTLPHLPFGLGDNKGLSTLKITDGANVSPSVVWVSQNQLSFYKSMRLIPNKVLAYSEGEFVYIISTLPLSTFTASVTMVSGGSPTNLDSTLNVPDDYLVVVTEYIKQQLMQEQAVPRDTVNDGVDVPSTHGR